jgi:transcriptional regulator with XRE-family HTH domain
MTLGEKIKGLRKDTNITQEELAEKIGVSRQAVTKWESDLGMPDVENLKSIATLFNITIDELLDYKKEILGDIVLEESYSLDDVKVKGKARCKEEQYVVNKFTNANAVYSLSRKKKWTGLKWIFYLVPGHSPEMEDYLENGVNIFCLVEEKDKQYIVMLHKGTMLVFQLKTLFSNKKLEVNGYIYTKNYKIK